MTASCRRIRFRRRNELLVVCCAVSSLHSVWGWILTNTPRTRRHSINKRALSFSSSPAQPFGEQSYWQDFYRSRDAGFTWYAGWEDLQPLVEDFLQRDHRDTHVLVPGVGTDSLLTDLYDAGYIVSAFDYATESIAFCRSNLNGRLIDLENADCRSLPYTSQTFDVVLDKGTLDAIYINGATNPEKIENLQKAVTELQRVLRPGGIFWSLSGICIEALPTLASTWDGWECFADGSFYTTKDGYTSNNVDGSLFVWKKPSSVVNE